MRSPLLVAVALLVIVQLLPSDKAEWPYLVGPSLLVPIVLAIADPALGGHKVFALGALAGLVLAGCAAARGCGAVRAAAAAPPPPRSTRPPASTPDRASGCSCRRSSPRPRPSTSR